MKITGGCHCRSVRFEAEVPSSVEVLDCNCSICAMTGFRHLMVPHGDFELLSGRETLTSYRFGTGAAGSAVSMTMPRHSKNWPSVGKSSSTHHLSGALAAAPYFWSM